MKTPSDDVFSGLSGTDNGSIPGASKVMLLPSIRGFTRDNDGSFLCEIKFFVSPSTTMKCLQEIHESLINIQKKINYNRYVIRLSDTLFNVVF